MKNKKQADFVLRFYLIFRLQVYGETITVVRTAMASGSGTYKLKDERGRIVRDKKVKEELERILSCFSIQVRSLFTRHFKIESFTYIRTNVENIIVFQHLGNWLH